MAVEYRSAGEYVEFISTKPRETAAANHELRPITGIVTGLTSPPPPRNPGRRIVTRARDGHSRWPVSHSNRYLTLGINVNNISRVRRTSRTFGFDNTENYYAGRGRFTRLCNAICS